MRYIILTTLAAFAARCTAQSLATLDNLPNCAKPCANNLPTQCNLGVQCICSDQAFITSISCCISTACSPSDQQQTLQVAQQLCDTVNVKLPSAAACSGSSSVASSATGASSASSATSAATAATGTASSAVSHASTSGTSATSSVGATGGTATGSTTSTTPSSTATAKGAGERLGSNIGAVGAAVAALALL